VVGNWGEASALGESRSAVTERKASPLLVDQTQGWLACWAEADPEASLGGSLTRTPPQSPERTRVNMRETLWPNTLLVAEVAHSATVP